MLQQLEVSVARHCLVAVQGKVLMLITNSDYHYTNKMMSFAYNRFMPPGSTWRDLFDMVCLFPACTQWPVCCLHSSWQVLRCCCNWQSCMGSFCCYALSCALINHCSRRVHVSLFIALHVILSQRFTEPCAKFDIAICELWCVLFHVRS